MLLGMVVTLGVPARRRCVRSDRRRVPAEVPSCDVAEGEHHRSADAVRMAADRVVDNSWRRAVIELGNE